MFSRTKTSGMSNCSRIASHFSELSRFFLLLQATRCRPRNPRKSYPKGVKNLDPGVRRDDVLCSFLIHPLLLPACSAFSAVNPV